MKTRNANPVEIEMQVFQGLLTQYPQLIPHFPTPSRCGRLWRASRGPAQVEEGTLRMRT